MDTVLTIELAALDVGLVAATVIGWRMWRDVLAKIVDRERALDMHVKAVTREALRATGDAARSVAAAQRTLEDARLTHERVDRHMADPRLKRLLDG